MEPPIIEFRGFGFRYRTQAEPTLRDITLSIYPGQKVLVAGPSGSGKSTLSRCINALIPNTYEGEATGSVTVCGQNPLQAGVFGMSRHVGTVLQDTDGQFIGLTVGEDIAFALENDCVPRDQMQRRVQEAAQSVGVQQLLQSSPRALSGGQKQKVSMAGVLVGDVDVLLLDEPLANLDPASGRDAMALIDRLQKQDNKTVIIIEHRIEDALSAGADRLVLMDDGAIVADGKPDDLLSAGLIPRHGMREPLHIAALRLFGCDIRPQDGPSDVTRMNLEPYRDAVTRWFTHTEPPKETARGQALIEFSGVDYTYPAQSDAVQPKKALGGVSFAIRRGDMVSIVGKNGAGKTTLSSLLCGFIAPDSGTITIGGADARALSIKERGERIGLVMQNPNQMISKPLIFDEVALGLRARGMAEAEVTQKVHDALATCGLYPFRNWPVGALSFGQKKRVTIAAILALSPDILILDEPTAGQDFAHYTEIMEFLRTLNLRDGITILMITHDMHLMLEYTTRSLVLADGALLADLPPEQVLADEGLTERAGLRTTSLHTLAARCGIGDRAEFARRFIQCDRRARA